VSGLGTTPVMTPIARRQVRITVVAAITISGCVLKLVSDMMISLQRETGGCAEGGERYDLLHLHA
jgi:hypothetical protein